MRWSKKKITSQRLTADRHISIMGLMLILMDLTEGVATSHQGSLWATNAGDGKSTSYVGQ